MLDFLKTKALYISGFANVALILSLWFTGAQWRDAEHDLKKANAALKTERELCDTEKMLAAAEAGRITREIQLQAQLESSLQLSLELQATKEALRDAEQTASEAAGRAEQAQALLEGQSDDPDDCGNTGINPDTWMRLRETEASN